MKEEIAYRIRMARLYKGLSQENVAVELGLTTAAYSNIERGITDISVSRLAQISRILEKEISELMGFLKPNATEGDLVYEKAFGEQIVLLSQQIAQLQTRLDSVETEVKRIKGRKVVES